MADRKEELARLEMLERRIARREAQSQRLDEEIKGLRTDLADLRRQAASLAKSWPAPEPQPEPEPKPLPEPAPLPAPEAETPPPLPAWARALPQALPPPPAPLEPAMDLETRIGAVWLNRLGLAALVIAFALFARHFHRQLLPWHKTAGGYLATAVLLALGVLLDKKHRLFARPVLAGGLAIGFFTSFAAGFLTPMLCLSVPVSLVLMSAFTLGIFVCAERWRSEATAGFAIVLGHVAAYVAGGEADIFSLVSVLFLSAAAVVLFVRHDWAPLNLLAVAGAYASHLLWALQDHAPSSPQVRFWANCGFFASYHLVFLVGDLLYQSRAAREPTRYSRARHLSARAVLPISLVLYGLFTAGIFRVTEIYWGRIDWWLFALAAVEAGVALLHHRWRSRDTAFHALAAAAFATLGLFARFDGLTLNLALAVEACLVLVFASRAEIWYLQVIAQGALAVNFVHYWFSDVRTLRTWPAFAGGVITAAVYLLGARLEQAWKLLRPLACLHAMMAGALLVNQSLGFRHPPVDAVLIASFAAIVTGITLLRHVESYAFAVATLVGGAGLAFLRAADSFGPGLDADWIWCQVTLTALSGCALVLCWQAEKLASRVARVGSILAFIALAGAAITGQLWGVPNLWLFPLWLAAPVAFWAAAEIPSSRWAWAYGIGGAGLTAQAARRTLGSFEETLWFLAATAAAQLAYVLWRDRPRLLAGLVAHGAAMALVCLYDMSRGPLDRVVYAVAAGVPLWTAALLLLGAGLKRRGSFAVAGLAALGGGLAFLLLLFASPMSDVLRPEWAWLAAVASLWFTAEGLRRLSRAGSSSVDDWRDTHGWERCRDVITPLSMVASIFAAGLWLFIQYRSRGENPAAVAAFEAIVALVLLGVAVGLRSLPLAVGHAFSLVAALAFFFVGELFPGGRDAAATHAGVCWLLSVTAMLSGATADLLLRRRRAELDESRIAFATAGAWLAWVPGIALGSWFLSVCPQGVFFWRDVTAVRPWLLHAAGAGFATTVWGFARHGRLPHGQNVAHGLLLAWAVKLASECLYQPDQVARSVVTALAVMAMLIVVERWSRVPALRLGSIITAAATLLIAIAEAPELEGVWTTVGWSLAAFVLTALGFVFKDRNYRRTGLVVFGLTIVRVVMVDVARLETFYRMLAFLGLGASLLVVSFLYTKFRDEIRKWI